MFEEFPFLSILILLPIIGALFILFFTKSDKEADNINAKRAALWTSIFTFLFSLIAFYNFDPMNSGFQFEEKILWLDTYNINLLLGIDAISLIFIMLTTFLLPICILASWESIDVRVKEFMVAFLMMESFVIGVFCAMDFLIFYIFFEAMLIPMFLIIGIWGSDNRVYAAFKFFLYTLVGSVLLLIAMIYIYQVTGTTNMLVLNSFLPNLPLDIQKWLWLAFFASFAVKVPMWPVHTWLPDAHVQAPTAGSVILAGVLIKMGAYGFLRFSLPMLPDASVYFADFVYVLSVIAVIYTSLVALAQTDMKKLIAYSSVAHMGFVTIGIFSFNPQGIQGALVQMLSHGFISAALFLSVGVLYDRMHTKDIDKYGGVTQKMPIFAAFFMFFTLASVGLPGTSGFVGEFLSLVGIYQVSTLYAALAATGLVLGAVYMLYLYKRVMFGEIENREVNKLIDLNLREKLYFAPIVAFVLLIGIYPVLVTSYLEAPTANIISQMNRSSLFAEKYKLQVTEIENIQLLEEENDE